MNKIAKANVVYSGWMVKSPPEKKFRLPGAWKIFRAKWKRRYFVLFKPASSLPHQYLLNYYTDENLKKLKGCIDLEHCEQVIESLDLDLFPFLLALKTYHKGRERTYFLATDTEDQMTTWVRNLCSVCGLKPEDNASDLPPDRTEIDSTLSGPTSPSTVTVPARTSDHWSPPVTAQPHNEVSMRHSHGRPASRSESRYIPISECFSGQTSPPDRRSSVDSIPDEVAPPPPVKAPKPLPPQPDVDENDVFHQSTYDTPPKKHDASDDDEVYKVPPPRRHHEEATLDVYDVPPPARQSPSTPRSSSSESQKVDSAYSSQSGLTYDYPPTHGGEKSADDMYDVPPTHPHAVGSNDLVTDAPPPRPPKPSLTGPQDPYQNLPPNAKVYQRATKNSMDLNKVVPPTMSDGSNLMSYDVPPPPQCTVHKTPMYDLPKPQPQSVSGKDNSGLLAIPPPPRSCSGLTSHSYINAAKGYVPTPPEKKEDVYLPMERAFPPSDSLNNNFQKSIDLNYADMSGPSPDMAYTDMSGSPPDYDTPPARPPARLPPRISSRHNHEQGDTYTIFSNPRTRSFKRNGSSSSEHSRPEAPMMLRVELPSRCGNENHHPDLSTSSEDEDESVLGDPAQVMVPFSVLTAQSRNIWTRTPPAPSKQEGELKYLDLALDDNSDKEPMRSPHSHTGHSTPTDYREIDFVKTQALSEVKKSVDIQRKPQH